MTDKITIFKEVFDYYYDGEITKEQLADLLLMHYETRWGDGVDAKEIEDKDLRMIWRTLQHSVIKSTKNAKQYEKQQNKKSAFQEVKETEFDIPNCQTPNTSDLSPSNDEGDNLYPQERENPSEGLKTTKEEEIDDNINNTEEDMGTFIGDFKELNSKTTTPNVEEEFDNFSDELNDLLDANEAKTEQIAQAKYLRKYLGIKNDAAYELSIKYYNQLKEQLTTEKDIEDLNKYLREKAEMKHTR